MAAGGVGQHPAHHGGDGDEDGGAVPGDLSHQHLDRGLLGEQDRRGTHREREEEVRPGGVAEDQLGDRQRDVVLPVAQRLVGVAERGVEERPVGLHHRLGDTGGTPGEQPERRVVAVGGGRGDIGGEVEPVVGHRQQAGWRRRGSHRGGHHRAEPGLVDHRLGRGEVEDLGDAPCSELRVHHHHHGRQLQRPEQRTDVLGPVGEQQHDTVLAVNPEVGQSGGEPAGEAFHLAVAVGAVGGAQRDAVAPALTDPVRGGRHRRC